MDRASLIDTEWAREWDRKTSLERRAITVITASGVLVTLIFGFASAVSKGMGFGNFTGWEKILLGVSLGFFAASGVAGVLTNNAAKYGSLPLDKLRPSIEKIEAPVAPETFENMIDAVEQARDVNDDKATLLAWAVSLMMVAIIVLAVSVIAVVA